MKGRLDPGHLMMIQEHALLENPDGATRKVLAETSHRPESGAQRNDAQPEVDEDDDDDDAESLVAEEVGEEEEEEEEEEIDDSNDRPQHASPKKVQPEANIKHQHGLVPPRRLLRHKLEPLPFEHLPNPPTRSKSPFSRAHLRSRSTNAVTMTRAHSSPGSSSSDLLTSRAAQQTYQSHQSPAVTRTPPARQRSPFTEDHPHTRPRSPRSWELGTLGTLGISSIQEDVALDIPLSRPPVLLSRSGGSLRRSRPASPLHSVTNAVTIPSGTFSADGGGSGSPMLGPMQRHYSNEVYPGGSTASSSSVSSTPTSWMSRSRSPSISSLETIEDAGEEVEMKEAEEVEKLREAADAEGRRSSFDGGSGRLRSAGRERKRWSVCGGERRGDLDLETIWED